MQLRAILANGKFWSGILVFASFSRGTAYIERPPTSQTLAGRAIETYIGYPAWGVMLLVTATFIMGGHLLGNLRVLGVIGHAFSVLIYGTFGLSLGLAAIVSQESWANTGLFLVGAALHVACAVFFADEISRHKEGGK